MDCSVVYSPKISASASADVVANNNFCTEKDENRRIWSMAFEKRNGALPLTLPLTPLVLLSFNFIEIVYRTVFSSCNMILAKSSPQ